MPSINIKNKLIAHMLSGDPLKKGLIVLLLFLVGPLCLAQENGGPYDLQVSALRTSGRFNIKASFLALTSMCEAYAYLTDYEGAKNIPGIVESKVIKRDGNKITVERLIEERILFFPVRLHSTVEYTELPNLGLNFIQIKGDNNSYAGTWRLQATEKGVQMRYESIVEPNSVIPGVVIEYFIQNNIRRRFEIMAERMERNRDVLNLTCR